MTGASSGIGRAASLALAANHVDVVAAGRSEERTMRTVRDIVAGGGSARYVHLDLSSLDSVRLAARELRQSGPPLDVLVNNAGLGVARGLTEDGFEIHFGVNHLGHFLLTKALMDSLGRGARVVTVSSEMHRRASGIDFDAVRRRTRSVFGMPEYSTSKLANILFTSELARRRRDLGCHSVHPGLTGTPIIPRYVRPFLRNRVLTAEQAADTVVWCAISDDVRGESGMYYARRTSRQPSSVARDAALAAELWERSEQWTASFSDDD